MKLHHHKKENIKVSKYAEFQQDRSVILHESKPWKVKFFILCDVIFLLRLQGKFEIDHSWEWQGWSQLVQWPINSKYGPYSYSPIHCSWQPTIRVMKGLVCCWRDLLTPTGAWNPTHKRTRPKVQGINTLTRESGIRCLRPRAIRRNIPVWET